MKKWIIVLIGVLCIITSATAQRYQLDSIIIVNYSRTPVKEVLKDLQRRYRIEFSYADDDAVFEQPVTLKLSGKTAREVFVRLFEPLGIAFFEVGTTIVLKTAEKKPRQIKAGNKAVTLSGFIREKGSLEWIPGATVYIPSIKTGVVSNNYGFYSLTIPAGEYVIQFTCAGFDRISDTVLMDRSMNRDVFIVPSSEMEEIIVSSHREVPVSQDTRISTVDILMSQVKRLPALAGEKDVFQVSQMNPGEQRGVEGTSGYYVRGGTADQNLVILDDAPVYNASHVFGLFSIFNGDAIKSAELIKGGFPARYGERLSSVLVMNMKDGNKEKLAGEFGIGLISSRFTLEGPIQKGKSSFLLSGRRTYGDLLAKPFLPKGINAGYYFYDLNAKINTTLNKKNHLYLSAYLGKDNLYSDDKQTGYLSKSSFGWGNQTVTARWNHVFNNKVFSNTSFIYSNYKFKSANKDVYNGEQSTSMYISSIRDFGIKHDIDWSPVYQHTLRLGVRSVLHRFTPSALKKTGTRDYQNMSEGESVDSWENNVYVEDNWTASERIFVNAGIRGSSFSTQGTTYYNIEPRLSTRVLLTGTLSVKASYSKMNQYLNLVSNTNIGFPTDLWIPATKRTPPQRSGQWALALAKDLRDQKYALTLEGYYKRMSNLVTYREGASFIVAGIDEDANVPENITWEDNITTGKGKSYGIELLGEKKKGRLTGWIGYTWSRTIFQFEKINNGRPYRPVHDRRHNFTALGIYDINKRTRCSFGWTYLSGSPITVMKSSYTALTNGPLYNLDYTYSQGTAQNIEMAEYSGKGEYVTDAYHRLDIGIQFIKQKKRGTRTWEIGIYNVYNRFNPFYYGYESTFDYASNKEDSRLKKYAYAPIIPSITYSFKF
ncbi:MAG: TonB-dependent receptor [Chitinophagaceae bacterium]|nr:TonB-dependent receptor [Chitinophagaceae bacterium]